MSLTDVNIRNEKPGTRAKRLWDSGGLYLEITPAGGKLWRFKYRHLGKEKLLALGKWKAVSLSMAPDARDDAKKLLARGIDRAVRGSRPSSRLPPGQRTASSRSARE